MTALCAPLCGMPGQSQIRRERKKGVRMVDEVQFFEPSSRWPFGFTFHLSLRGTYSPSHALRAHQSGSTINTNGQGVELMVVSQTMDDLGQVHILFYNFFLHGPGLISSLFFNLFLWSPGP